MTAKLSVTVAVDLDVASVTVRAAGALTWENVRGLIAVVRRAERTLSGFAVLLDLSQLLACSPEASRILRESGAQTVPPGPVDGRYPIGQRNTRGLAA